ncbi:MAG: hypothetical protein DRJ64_02105 [Thermoprotei archaeon]|nr:MAG: hypothetical protein DRJ64_02105 [Thermoprotei archaeon]
MYFNSTFSKYTIVMKSLSHNLSKIYSLGIWNEDSSTPEGRNRLERALKYMELLVNHRWFKELVASKTKMKILEILLVQV